MPDSERARNRLIERMYGLFAEYEDAVMASSLAAASKTDLVYFGELFLRWLDNDYTPGQNLADAFAARDVETTK